MPNEQYNAYSLYCRSLDTMASAFTFGCSMMRAMTIPRGHFEAFPTWEETHPAPRESLLTGEAEPSALQQLAPEVIDERAQRLLARFVDPGPDFFEKSPFEDWETFSAPTKSTQ